MKHSHAKRHWFIASLLCIAVLVCVLTLTTFAASRTNKIAKINLVLNENIDILFWADIDEDTAKASDTYVTFNDGDAVSYSTMKASGGTSYAVYRYNDVLPQNMADSVTAKLYVGGTLKDTQTYSVKEYAQYMLTNSGSDALKKLVSDMLVYGAAAQTYLGESSTVTADVTGLTAGTAPDTLIVLNPYLIEDTLARTEEATFDRAGLILSNSVQMYFDVTIPSYDSTATYSAKLRVGGREQEVSLTATADGYRAVFTDVYASEFFDEVSVGIYKNSARISQTANYSVAQYLKTVKEDSTSEENLVSLVNAIYNYGVSARAYTGNHVVTMPGETSVTAAGTSSLDPYGTVTYHCYLCGKDMGEISVSHIRTFDDTHANAYANNGTTFTANTSATETVNGETNTYMTVMRGSNTGTGAWGYYFYPSNSQILQGLTFMPGSSFTFEMDIRAPEGGLAPVNITLRNDKVNSGDTGRFNTFLNINTDGSLSNNGSTVAPSGTVSSSKWTHITMMIELCEVNGEKCVYTEYYVDGVFCSAVLAANTVGLDSTVEAGKYTFTDIYIGMGPTGVTSEMGAEFDNFIFGQGAVHSFSTSVEEYLQKQDAEQILEVIDLIEAGFDTSDFTTVVTSSSTTKQQASMVTLDTTAYDNPFYYPTTGQHPRLLFTEDDIPSIIAAMSEEENASATTNFLAKVSTATDGKLGGMHALNGPGSYNYDDDALGAIEAKALYYALFKDSTDANRQDALMRGYQAIYAMKNYLLTFEIEWKASDQCRLYGHVMYVAALVYDWCYDLLSEADKEQIMLGVQNMCCDGTSSYPEGGSTHGGIKLEVGFPPSPSGTLITGHNAEYQVLRDLFAFSIAIYDEVPSWYDYIGGMICQDYIPTRNYIYTSGYYPDGSAIYNYYRFSADLWNAWLFEGMGAELPYNAEDMSSIVHGLITMETYDGNQFATGDGVNTTIPSGVADCGLISSYLFEDSTARAIAMHFHNNYQSFYYSQNTISAADYLILSSKGVETGDDYQAKVKNAVYHGGYQQQVIARDGKDEDSVVVLMQGGQLVPGGHTHQSAGSFQIYYKGQLTRDDGLYDSYGYDHHYYYHMSTVAHNSLLIYNPNLAGSLVGSTTGTSSSGVDLYSGGQRHWSEYASATPRTYSTWLTSSTHRTGKNIGYQTDSEESPSYVYFANDITLAYDEETVDYVERSINTVFTGDSSVPMVMFIFDHIDSDDATYQKTFLLQCATAPSISGTVVTVDNGTSKLVLTSLQGADTIKAYGRTSVNGVVGSGTGSERFWLSNANGGSGFNLTPGGLAAGSLSSTAEDLAEVWGHVEILPNTGNKENLLMNVIYVTDSGTTVSTTPTLISGTNVLGASFMNNTSVFVKDPSLAASTLSFTSTGSGTMSYYVGGLNAGTWSVSIGGTSLGSFTVTGDGNMLAFEGAVGTVTVTPVSVQPAGTSEIRYNLNGGTLPSDAPTYYTVGTGTSLPIPTKDGYAFNGWYADESLTTPVNSIGTDETADPVVLYAGWTEALVSLDYTKGNALSDYKAIAGHNTGNGGSYTIVGTAGDAYLLMNAAGSDASVIKTGAYASLLNGETSISFEFTIAQDGSNTIQASKIWFRDYNGDSQYNPHIFYLKNDGTMGIGSSTSSNSIGTLTSTPTTVRIVIDFAVAKIYAYNADGSVLASCDLSGHIAGNGDPVSSAVYNSYESWLAAFTETNNYLFSFQSQGVGYLRIYGISVMPGNIYSNCRFYDAGSSAHTWNSGTTITAASTTDCTPGVIKYTCQSCGLVKYGAIASTQQHTLTHTATDGKPTYSCTVCKTSWTPSTYTWADGTGSSGVSYVTNSNWSYSYANGYYEMIKSTTTSAQGQLWIPSNGGSKLTDFSTTSNAVGFLSFKISASGSTDESITMLLTQNERVQESGDESWNDKWRISDSILTVKFTKTWTLASFGYEYYATFSGWSGDLTKVTLSGEKAFTDWIDVKIGIEMNEANDSITLHYFIGGSYIGSATKTVALASNSISCVYVSTSQAASGTGIRLDDVGFGYTTDGSEIPVN